MSHPFHYIHAWDVSEKWKKDRYLQLHLVVWTDLVMIMTVLVMLLIPPLWRSLSSNIPENNWPPDTQMVPSGHSRCGQNIRIQYGFLWAGSTPLERLLAPLSGRGEPWGADVASPQGQSGRVLTGENRSTTGVATWLAIVLHISSHSHNTDDDNDCRPHAIVALNQRRARAIVRAASHGFSHKNCDCLRMRLFISGDIFLTSTGTGIWSSVVLNIAV